MGGMKQMTRRGWLVSAGGVVAARGKVRVLVIDGINNHDWAAGTRAIVGVLRGAGLFAVEVLTAPAAGAAAWERWRPEFSRFDVVVNNFNGGHTAAGVRWPAAVERDLSVYLQRGGGMVVFHAANNAFLEWAEYNEMIGLGWRDKGFGPGLVVDEQERVVVVPAGEGLGPGHGPRHDFQMTTRDPRHAITLGFPKVWMHPAEQLTHGQHGPAAVRRGALEKELTILTYAWSKDSQRREPMDWVRRWGKGRIYTTMLGHTWQGEENPNLRCVGFRTLLARGVEWAGTGRVSLGVPERMPSAGEVVLGAEELG
jgi:hypothetical protein